MTDAVLVLCKDTSSYDAAVKQPTQGRCRAAARQNSHTSQSHIAAQLLLLLMHLLLVHLLWLLLLLPLVLLSLLVERNTSTAHQCSCCCATYRKH